jgi:hypothetical protein
MLTLLRALPPHLGNDMLREGGGGRRGESACLATGARVEMFKKP